MELISDIMNWVRYKYNEINENYSLIDVFRNNKWKKIYSKNLYPGDIYKIHKDSKICVDSICIYSPDTEHPKICLSTLTGEADLIPVESLYASWSNKITRQSINIINYYHKSLNKLKIEFVKSKKIINENYFLAGGGINMDNDIIAIAVACGKNKKCYHQSKCDGYIKRNLLDKKNADYMMRVNTRILLLKILLLTISSLLYQNGNSITKYFNLYILVQRIIQNWILFNGVIPFSIKIINSLSRYFQSKYVNDSIYFNNTYSVDQFPYIQKIISDKTGTLTCNKMEFKMCVIGNKLYGYDS